MSPGGAGNSPLPAVHGVIAALALPVHLRGERLRRLTMDPVASGRRVSGDHKRDSASSAEAACRAGLRTLRLMSRLRIPGWRSTCLYRSALRCLLLRRDGRPAVLRIGARRGEASIEAHAWVEVGGEVVPDEAAPYAPLRRATAIVG